MIIVSIDTLRADHVGCYGGSVATPILDAFAKDAILFESAWAQVPLTLPSHVSFLTGLLPADAEVRSNLGYRFDASKHASIPTILRSRGYWTGAAVSAYVLRRESGLGDAFDSYDDELGRTEAWSVGDLQRSGRDTVDAAMKMLNGAPGSRPVFFMLHLFEPHTPYDPPEPYRSAHPDSPYAGEVATADAVLGTFFDGLRAAGLYDRSLIVVLSDHGEGLDDHGEAEHGIFLYREAIQVPLLVKLPGGEMAGTRVKAPAQLADLMPTIAEVTGFDVPSGAEGVSLLELARGATPDRRIFSETMYPRIHLGWSDLVSLVDDQWHYIDAPRPELFDIASDLAERTNVLEANRRVYAERKAEASLHSRELTAPSDIDPEDEEKLRALGYLGGASAPGSGELPDPKDRIGDLAVLARASDAVRQESFAQAIPLLEDLLVRNPGFADAWTLLARSYEKTGRDDDAVRAYTRAIEASPALAAGTSLSIAGIALRQGKPDDCIANARLALESHPGPARALLARASLAKRDWGAVEEHTTALMRDDGRRLEAQVLLARARIGQKQLDEALVILDGAAREAQAAGKPPVPDLFLAQGDALALQGNVMEAERSMASEIRYFPANREAYVRLAALQALSGRLAEARRTLEAMVHANPQASSWELAAQTMQRFGDEELARQWRERARGMR